MNRKNECLLKFGLLSAFSVANAFGQPIKMVDLFNLLDSKKIESVNAFLSELPDQLKANQLTSYSSRASSHTDVSGRFPRITTFGNDARLLLSVHGNSERLSYNTVEAIEFDDETDSFVFYEISFPPKRDKAGKLIRPDKNPTACLGCHGNPPRPNWEPYPFWPGFRGSEEGIRFDAEDKVLAPYEEVKKTDKRYKILAGKEMNPADFGLIIGDLQYRNFARQISDDTSFRPFRYLLLGAFYCPDTDSLKEFFPKDGSALSKIFFQLIDDFKMQLPKEELSYRKTLIQFHGKNLEIEPEKLFKKDFAGGTLSTISFEGFDKSSIVDIYARIAAVLKLKNKNLGEFSLSFGRKPFFSNGFGTQFTSMRPLLALRLLTETELKEMNELIARDLLKKVENRANVTINTELSDSLSEQEKPLICKYLKGKSVVSIGNAVPRKQGRSKDH